MTAVKKAREKYILARIHQYRDSDSFSEVYDLLVEPIYRFIFFKVNDKELAQDLTAEVFLKAWKGLVEDNERRVRHLKAYFYTMARNLVVDHYRKEEKQREQPLEEARHIPTEQNMEQGIQVAVDAHYILQYVLRLKDSYKEVLVLKYVEDLSTVEIGKVIQKTPVATRVLLHRAHKALKREYEKSTPTN